MEVAAAEVKQRSNRRIDRGRAAPPQEHLFYPRAHSESPIRPAPSAPPPRTWTPPSTPPPALWPPSPSPQAFSGPDIILGHHSPFGPLLPAARESEQTGLGRSSSGPQGEGASLRRTGRWTRRPGPGKSQAAGRTRRGRCPRADWP